MLSHPLPQDINNWMALGKKFNPDLATNNQELEVLFCGHIIKTITNLVHAATGRIPAISRISFENDLEHILYTIPLPGNVQRFVEGTITHHRPVLQDLLQSNTKNMGLYLSTEELKRKFELEESMMLECYKNVGSSAWTESTSWINIDAST